MNERGDRIGLGQHSSYECYDYCCTVRAAACDTCKWYLASTTTVHEQKQCLNCFCVIFLCTARPRQAETNYHLCNTSTCCPNFSRPRPPCGYLAAARQAMFNPDECTPWCMSSLPYLTAAQQRLQPQNVHDWGRSRPETCSPNSDNR